MSTRSTIAILKLDGSVSSVYCHGDGYLSYNGIMLARHYQKVDKVKKLIGFGDLSSLDENVEAPVGTKHSFDSRAPGITTFYGRDRGETGIESRPHESLEKYMTDGDFQQYDYVFDETKESWFLINHKTKKLQKLIPLLVKDKEITGDDRQFLDNIKKSSVAVKLKTKMEQEIPPKENAKKVKSIKV